MTRALYRSLVQLHPPAFRREFGDEMVSIFDEAAKVDGAGRLFADGVLSLGRQWLVRAGTWKVAVAAMAGFAEILLAYTMAYGPPVGRSCGADVPQAESAAYVTLARFSGQWKGNLKSTGPSGFIELTLAWKGAAWMGTIQLQGPDGGMHGGAVEDIQVEGDVLRFRVRAGDADMNFNGRLRLGRLTGTLEATANGKFGASGPKGKKVGEGIWQMSPASPQTAAAVARRT